MDAIRKLTAALDWLRIPFTFGEACSLKLDSAGSEGRELNDDVQSKCYNGLISSCQLFIAMEVAFVVQLFSYYMQESARTVSGMQLRIDLMVYMAAGLVVMLTIYRKRQSLVSPVDSGDVREAKALEHDIVILTGILMFYVLGTVDDLLHIMSSFSCHEVWFACGFSYFVANEMVHIAYHIVRIIFLSCQTLFCMVFNHARFADQSMTRHSLMILQAVNLSFWTYEFVRASASENRGLDEFIPRKISLYRKDCVSNASNYSFDPMSCYINNDTLYHYTTKYSNGILRPFSIEYSLLIGECLMSWFFTCTTKSTENVNLGTSQKRLDSHRGSENRLDAGNTVTLRNCQTRSPAGQADQQRLTATLAPVSPPQEESSSQVLPRQVPSSQASQLQFLKFLLLMISIIVNLILTVLIFAPRILNAVVGPSVHQESMRAIAPYYSCFYYTLMICVIGLGYHVSRRFRVVKNVPFGGLDYLLLFASSGNLAFDLLRLIAITRSSEKDVFTSSTTRLFYAGYVFFEVVETSFQVSFSLYAARLRVNNRANSLESILFRAIVLFLAFCNLTTWIIHTFAVSVTSHSMMMRYFGKSGWPFVSNVLMPMFLFFRFNSFLMFVRIYRRLRRRSTNKHALTATS